ncbi:MAG: hypothetical protein R3C05_01580 [Pirellulaceae bacterium]
MKIIDGGNRWVCGRQWRWFGQRRWPEERCSAGCGAALLLMGRFDRIRSGTCSTKNALGLGVVGGAVPLAGGFRRRSLFGLLSTELRQPHDRHDHGASEQSDKSMPCCHEK